MENARNANPKLAFEKMALAKILLNKFGAIHTFHVMQLEKYPIACCNIGIDGLAQVDVKTKTVKFIVLTTRSFYRKDGMTHERSKYSLIGRLKVSNRRYKKEQALAIANLTAWTSELLWGENTKVEVEFDGDISDKSDS